MKDFKDRTSFKMLIGMIMLMTLFSFPQTKVIAKSITSGISNSFEKTPEYELNPENNNSITGIINDKERLANNINYTDKNIDIINEKNIPVDEYAPDNLIIN